MEFPKVTLAKVGMATRVVTLQLRGFGQTGDDTDAEPTDNAELVQPLGLFANPSLTAETEAVTQRLGDQAVALAVIDKSLSVLSCPPGTTILVSCGNASCLVKCNADGSMDLATASGQDVRFNGGSTPVAKEGSTATHTHLPGTFNAGPWSVVGVSASTAAAIDAGTGSPHVKVP